MNSTTATSDQITNRDLGPPGSSPPAIPLIRRREQLPQCTALSKSLELELISLLAEVNKEAQASILVATQDLSFMSKLSLAYRWSLAKSLRVSSTLQSKPGFIHFYEE